MKQHSVLACMCLTLVSIHVNTLHARMVEGETSKFPSKYSQRLLDKDAQCHNAQRLFAESADKLIARYRFNIQQKDLALIALAPLYCNLEERVLYFKKVNPADHVPKHIDGLNRSICRYYIFVVEYEKRDEIFNADYQDPDNKKILETCAE